VRRDAPRAANFSLFTKTMHLLTCLCGFFRASSDSADLFAIGFVCMCVCLCSITYGNCLSVPLNCFRRSCMSTALGGVGRIKVSSCGVFFSNPR
jgi:hypothetical protein